MVLPGGATIPGSTPIVVIGPNGSGKTRQSRGIGAGGYPVEFVNALRNTRVSPELPATGVDSARNNYANQVAVARGQHWELSTEFDWMLSQLAAQQASAAITFVARLKDDPSIGPIGPDETPLDRVEKLWAEVFPGRSLGIVDWKPTVSNESTGVSVAYSGNQMSDGEKSALYLAGRVFTFDGGLLVVDEPETHFHSLLAIRFWNALEKARPDIRFVYVTHDLTFAISRKSPVFVLASPTRGLRVLELESGLPNDVATTLLGSASLSFYASRVVFCEGTEDGFDAVLYNAWFFGQDTIVRPVEGYEAVIRCVQALNQPGITMSLQAVGIIDRDYRNDALISALPNGTMALRVHEIESLFCLPEVVRAVAAHLNQGFDELAYGNALSETVDANQERSIVVQRWKAAIEPRLGSLVSTVTARQHATISEIAETIPAIFDVSKWAFNPAEMLNQEASDVRAAMSGGTLELLRVVPGKQFLPVAARSVGMGASPYVELVAGALRGADKLRELGQAIEAALISYLPARAVVPIQEPPLGETV